MEMQILKSVEFIKLWLTIVNQGTTKKIEIRLTFGLLLKFTECQLHSKGITLNLRDNFIQAGLPDFF